MIIRKAKIKDCSACYELCRTPELLPLFRKFPARQWIESFVKEKQIFFVAEDSGKIVGFTMGEKTTGKEAIWQILLVKKEYRNLNIATKLLETVEKEYRKRGVKYVWVYSYAKNKEVNSILDKKGYKKGSLCYERLKKL